ncbi:hypothetical protein WOA01_13085 [Methylocystis sp. IM2]|uniref:hypothetical protein n=1 Tax=Methylocystis sp. IM2 TaxID=3136563 RepID=UPI0030F8E73B
MRSVPVLERLSDLVLGQAEDPEPHAIHLDDPAVGEAGHEISRAVAQIGGEARRLQIAHA